MIPPRTPFAVRPAVLGLLVFLAGALCYVAFYKAVTDDYFGGDVVTLFSNNPTSFQLPLSAIPDLGALVGQIEAAKGQNPETSPGAFVYARLPGGARQALERLTINPDDSVERERFIYGFNAVLVDVDPGWPEAMLAPYAAQLAARGGMPLPLYNRKALGLLFAPNIRPWKPLPDALALLRSIVIDGRANFTLGTPTRYAPLAVSYATFMIMYLQGGPDRFGFAVAQMAALFGCMCLAVYLFSRTLLGGAGPALLATVLCVTSLSVITSSMMTFSLPYLFVTISVCFALYGYLRFRDTGRARWLFLLIFFGIIGPWTREFAGIIPYVVIACELMDFRGRRSSLTLAVSVLLALHGLYPSLLPWLLGWNKGQVYSLLAMGKGQSLVSQNPNWHQPGFVFVHIPPVLWLIVVAGVCGAVARWSQPPSGVQLPFWQRVLLIATPKSPRLQRIAKTLALIGFVGLACAFVWSFFVVNAKLEHFCYLKQGVWLFAFMAAFALFSLRHHVLPPILFLAFLVGYLRWNVAEVHLSFLMPALAVMIVAWMRETLLALRGLAAGRLRTAALAAFWTFAVVGVGDQLLNVPVSATVQRRLIECNKQMGEWLRENTQKHAVVVANFFYYADLFYYSGFHFAPYESVENNPFGPSRVVHTDAQMEALLKVCADGRELYIIEAEHPFFEWQAGYHSNKWVKNPPGDMKRVAGFSLKAPYLYADPLKHFVPRFWMTFPGYMDWFTDYWWDKRGVFHREAWSDYSIYRCVVPGTAGGQRGGRQE